MDTTCINFNFYKQSGYCFVPIIALSGSFSTFICNLVAYYEWGEHLKIALNTLTPEDIKMDYITLNSKGQISFCPYGRTQEYTESGDWAKAGRNIVKPVKWVNTIFSAVGREPLTTEEVDEFMMAVRGTYAAISHITEVEDVASIYDMPHSNSGSLGSSCMIGKGYLYDDLKNIFGDRLRVAVYTKGDLLCGRALLWAVGDTVYMDRVYAIDDDITAAFFAYASKKGYIRKAFQSAHNTVDWVLPSGEAVCRVVKLGRYLEKPYIKVYIELPYMDTFKFIYLNNDDYVFDNNDNGAYEYKCVKTDGTVYDRDDCAVNLIRL